MKALEVFTDKTTWIFAGFYFGILLFLAWLTISGDKTLYDIMDDNTLEPTRWNLFLNFMYYVAPLAFAGVAARFFKPMVPRFAAVLLIIFGIHAAYGAAMTAARGMYVGYWEGVVEESTNGSLAIVKSGHKLVDKENDGLINEVAITAQFEPVGMPAGHYEVHVQVLQDGMVLPDGVIKQEGFDLEGDETENSYRRINIAATLNPRDFEKAARKAPLDIGFKQYRVLRTTPFARKLVRMCSWAAFFCANSVRNAYSDPEIQDQAVELPRIENELTIDLTENSAQRQLVIFEAYGREFLRDTNFNTRSDALVVTYKVDSVYEGPAYMVYEIAEIENSAMVSQHMLKKGQQEIELVVPGRKLKEWGVNGPYTVQNITLMNNPPACALGHCEEAVKPVFYQKLGDYKTQAYHLVQFE